MRMKVSLAINQSIRSRCAKEQLGGDHIITNSTVGRRIGTAFLEYLLLESDFCFDFPTSVGDHNV